MQVLKEKSEPYENTGERTHIIDYVTRLLPVHRINRCRRGRESLFIGNRSPINVKTDLLSSYPSISSPSKSGVCPPWPETTIVWSADQRRHVLSDTHNERIGNHLVVHPERAISLRQAYFVSSDVPFEISLHLSVARCRRA